MHKTLVHTKTLGYQMVTSCASRSRTQGNIGNNINFGTAIVTRIDVVLGVQHSRCSWYSWKEPIDGGSGVHMRQQINVVQFGLNISKGERR